VFVVIFSLSLFVRRENPDITNVSPTPFEALIDPTTTRGRLTITNIQPRESNKPYLPFQKITLTFSAPVSKETLVISTAPLTEIVILRGATPNEFFIVPNTTWQTGTTSITISRAISQDSTAELLSPVVFSITTSLPTLTPEELKDYP
jgi:hypothetical protein